MEDRLNLVKRLVRSCTGTSFSIINLTKEKSEEFLNSTLNEIPVSSLISKNHLSIKPNMQSGCIYELRFVFDICCMSYYSIEEKTIYMLGPFLTKPDQKQETQYQNLKPILRALPQLPIIPISKGYDIMTEILECIGLSEGFPYKIKDFREGRDSESADVLTQEEKKVLQMKQIERRYEKSSALTEAVKKGNFSLAVKFLTEINRGENLSTRNSNPLRNRQNYCIVMNTHLRYALEHSGVHPYRLDQFSSDIAIKIEKLKTLEEVDRFVFDTLRQYCELATEHIYPNLKPLVHMTVAYIKNYLTDNINVKTTAKELGVNANYLSTMFHSEMGVTFIDFLNKERIKQAAALIEKTDLQIQEIATAVGYNNGSYFAKQFKKYYNMSPIEYKKHIQA